MEVSWLCLDDPPELPGFGTKADWRQPWAASSIIYASHCIDRVKIYGQ